MDFYTNAKQIGNYMYVRGVRDGRRYAEKFEYAPYLFVKSKENSGEYVNVFKEPVKRIDFLNPKEARDFANQYDKVSGMELFGMNNFVYPFLNDNYTSQFDSDYINVVSTDIETMSDDGFPNVEIADKEITVITIGNRGNYVVIGVGDYKEHQPNVRYINCENERQLLMTFINELAMMNPDVLTGWNIEFFDVPYLINRIRRILGDSWANKLSPWGKIYDRNVKQPNGSDFNAYEIVGVSVLDYLQIYKKWTFVTRENYKLDHIAEVEELGFRKVDYSEYGSLHNLYVQNYQLYVEYNIRDTEIIDKLEAKLKLIELIFQVAYDAKINYNDTFSPVKTWDVIIHNYLMEQKIVVPAMKVSGIADDFMGGYVKNPSPGLYRWVVSEDLDSLYPHLIMQYGISPENYVQRLPFSINECLDILKMGIDKAEEDEVYRESLTLQSLKYAHANDLSITANGCLYKKEMGFLPFLMDKFYAERKAFKKKSIENKKLYEETKDEKYKKLSVIFDTIQLARKVLLNSAYGALANVYFRWYGLDFAESITSSGQLSIRWISDKINIYINKLLKTDKDWIIANDTDSCYIEFSGIVDHFYSKKTTIEIVDCIDKICKEALEPYIEKSYQELADGMCAYQQKMKMKREAISDKGIWTGAKYYVLNVWDLEGVRYSEPKAKVVGMAAVKSSTPAVCRTKIKEGLAIILNKTQDDLIDLIDEFREEFFKLPFDKVAFPRSLNNMKKYYDPVMGWRKGTPVQVRGAFVYNKLIADKKLTKTLQPLQDGDKIKFCYLKQPNPVKENVICCSDELPEEFREIEKYIDYATQFEKAFEQPMKAVADAVGWNLYHVSTLDALFS